MKNKIRYSPEALQDLDDIQAYITMELSSPDAAMNVTLRIMDAVARLQDFPEIGASLASISGVESDYRFLVCDNYLAFYRTDSEKVYIDRVLYGRRDYMRILFDEIAGKTKGQ